MLKRTGNAPLHHPRSDTNGELWALERLHLAQLESTGQVDEALAVLRADLLEPHAHSKVIRYLEQLGRFREAFSQAEQGLKAFPDDWRLQDDMLRCYERDGWTAEALAMRRAQFDRGPTVERYHLVLKAGLAAAHDVATLRQSLIVHLAALEVRDRDRSSYRPGFAARRSAAMPAGRDVSLRADVLGSEGRWIEASTLVQPPALCNDRVLGKIARHLPRDHKDRALALLLRVFDGGMERSKSPYRDELALVEEIGRHMDAARRVAWLVQLRIDYKAKRNFIRDLPEP